MVEDNATKKDIVAKLVSQLRLLFQAFLIVDALLWDETLAGLYPLAQTLENPLQSPAEKEPVPSLSPFLLVKTREQLFLPPSHGSLRKKRVRVVGSHGGCRENGMGRRESQLPLLPPSGALFGIRERRRRRRRQEGREDCHPLPAFGNFRVVAGMGCVCSREGGAMWTLRGGDAPGIG